MDGSNLPEDNLFEKLSILHLKRIKINKFEQKIIIKNSRGQTKTLSLFTSSLCSQDGFTTNTPRICY